MVPDFELDVIQSCHELIEKLARVLTVLDEARLEAAPAAGRGRPPRRGTSRNAVVSGPLVAAIGLLLIGCTGPSTVIPKAAPSPSGREAVATLPPLDLGPWQRYADPFVLVAGSNIRFRAVDVNGNIEATHELTA
jgi:hypothetical protein